MVTLLNLRNQRQLSVVIRARAVHVFDQRLDVFLFGRKISPLAPRLLEDLRDQTERLRVGSTERLESLLVRIMSYHITRTLMVLPLPSQVPEIFNWLLLTLTDHVYPPTYPPKVSASEMKMLRFDDRQPLYCMLAPVKVLT